MSLIFMDGFDDGLAFLGKWTAWNNPFVVAGGRSGNRAKFVDNSDSSMRRTVNNTEEHATFIVGFAFSLASSYNASNVLGFFSDTMVTQHIMMGVDSNNAIVIRRGDGTVLGTSSSNTLVPGTFQYIEVKVTLHDSTGEVTVKVNGATVLNLTGIDTKNGGTKTVLESVAWMASSGPTGTEFSIDDVYICNGAGSINNDFLGDCNVHVILPNGDGNYSQFVGSDGNSVSNYALVNEASPDSITYVESATPANKDTYAFADLPGGVTAIKGIATWAYAAKDVAGAGTIRQTARIAGTDYPGSDVSLGLSFLGYPRIMELSPASSGPWTPAEVNSAEFGVEAR